jgi:MYXO-CTERM domain-containing protein
VIALISVVGAVGIFLACLAAGRYASWFGVVIPVAITVALGEGWEWDPDATAFVIASALFGGLGLAAGLSRRRKRRAVNR